MRTRRALSVPAIMAVLGSSLHNGIIAIVIGMLAPVVRTVRSQVSLYVPLVVLMLVKHLHAREMEAYLAENVVARVCIGRPGDPQPQIRDHANMARAYAALGKEGLDESNALILHSPRWASWWCPPVPW